MILKLGLACPRSYRLLMSKRSLIAADSPSVAKKPRMSAVEGNGVRKATSGGEIDEDLHSRQLAVYGRDSMRRLAASQVLVLGATGLSVEVGEADQATLDGCAYTLRPIVSQPSLIAMQPRMSFWLVSKPWCFMTQQKPSCKTCLPSFT